MGNEQQPKTVEKPIEPKESGDGIHFNQIAIPVKHKLRDTGYDSGFEWIPIGGGRLKRIPKQKSGPHT